MVAVFFRTLEKCAQKRPSNTEENPWVLPLTHFVEGRDQTSKLAEMVGPYEFFACNYHVTIAWIVCNHFFWHVCI